MGLRKGNFLVSKLFSRRLGCGINKKECARLSQEFPFFFHGIGIKYFDPSVSVYLTILRSGKFDIFLYFVVYVI